MGYVTVSSSALLSPSWVNSSERPSTPLSGRGRSRVTRFLLGPANDMAPVRAGAGHFRMRERSSRYG